MTYVGLAMILFYGVGMMMAALQLSTDENAFLSGKMSMTIILVAFELISMPTKLWALASKTGIPFSLADENMLFTAPIDAKNIFIFSKMRSIVTHSLIQVVFLIWFAINMKESMGTILLFLLISFFVDNIIEMGLSLLLFASEKVTETFKKFVRYAIIVFLFLVVGLAFLMIRGNQINLSLIDQFVKHPILQLIPIIGWKIAFINAFFASMAGSAIGLASLIGVACYGISLLVAIVYIVKMKCNGEYYEDAVALAQMISTLKEKRKQGKRPILPTKNKTKKYKEITMKAKGYYAKAIYYKQLMVARRRKLFFINIHSIVILILGYFFLRIEIEQLNVRVGSYVLMLVILKMMAFGGLEKWREEYTKLYTYLIPDSIYAKLYYVTKLEIFKAMIDTALLVLPAVVTGRLPLLYGLIIVVLGIVLHMTQLYSCILIDGLLGDAVFEIMKQLITFALMTVSFTIVVIMVFVLGAIASPAIGLMIAMLISLAFCAFNFLIAGLAFARMETFEI